MIKFNKICTKEYYYLGVKISVGFYSLDEV